ncbi:nuclear transport factor 2 family protein [Mesorhizobium sp. M0976]|uniref:nuclear transport factor 2 family protein n=1 Tax=Mesorhizobium sp. M0976 TaxID=2957038 RepID=UPI00333AB1DE
MTLSLQEVSDRLEIEQLLARYCYAVDDRDWEAYRKIFTPDAVLDDTVTGGIRSGVDEHVAYMKGALLKVVISQHAISTILLDLRGDEASARVHCSCPMVVDLGEGKRQVFFQGLWYRDRVIRTSEGRRSRGRLLESQFTGGVHVLTSVTRCAGSVTVAVFRRGSYWRNTVFLVPSSTWSMTSSLTGSAPTLVA